MSVPSIAIAAAIALGFTAAGLGFAFFFNTPYSQLLPGVLWPGGALALGAFVASFATRSLVAGGYALVPAVTLPLVVSVWLLSEGQSVNGWPAVAVGSCIIALVASWLGKLVSSNRVIKGQASET